MNIKEVSEATGISKDMIRFYEKKGIISPSRNQDNNYRDYTIHDMHVLILAKQYNSLGIDLNTISSLLKNAPLGEMISHSDERLKILKEEAEWAYTKYQNALDLFLLLNKVSQGVMFDVGKRKTLYFYNNTNIDETSQFYVNGAIARPVYRFKLDDSNDNGEAGLLMSRKHPSIQEADLIIPEHTYYRIVKEIDASRKITKQELKEYIKEIENNGYQVTGDAYLYQLLGHIHHYDTDTVCIEFEVKKEDII